MKSAKQLLNEWCQKHGLKFPVYTTETTGTCHQPTHEVTATLATRRGTLTGKASHSNSKIAQQLAAATILRELGIKGGYEKVDTNTPTYANYDNNPLAELNEYAQRNGGEPAWTDEKQGLDHNPTFTTTVTYKGIVKTGKGRSKKAAHIAAATELMEELTNDF